MKYLVIAAASFGAILLFLLASASANTALFARHYPWLLGLNAVVALSLLALVAWQVRALWRDHRAKVFGSRLKLRLMLMFGLMAVLPGVLVYAVSVQFVTKSIETWFDVRVEKALESGLNLGRSALDYLLADLSDKGHGMALELGDRPDSQRRVLLNRLREQSGVQAAALFTNDGQLMASSTGDLVSLLTPIPSSTQLRQARSGRGYSVIEGESGKELLLRVLIPVSPLGLASEPRILQLTQPVPANLTQNAESVEAVLPRLSGAFAWPRRTHPHLCHDFDPDRAACPVYRFCPGFCAGAPAVGTAFHPGGRNAGGRGRGFHATPGDLQS